MHDTGWEPAGFLELVWAVLKLTGFATLKSTRWREYCITKVKLVHVYRVPIYAQSYEWIVMKKYICLVFGKIESGSAKLEFSNNYVKISTHILCSERRPTSTPSRRSSPPTGMPASPSTSTPCTQTHPLCTQRTQTPPTLHLGDFVRTCITENSLL